MSDTVDFVRCPMCQREFILAEEELVCEGCKPIMNVDLAVADLQNVLTVLDQADPKIVITRLALLLEARNSLTSILNKANEA